MRAPTEHEQKVFDRINSGIPWRVVGFVSLFSIVVGLIVAPELTTTVLAILLLSVIVSYLL